MDSRVTVVTAFTIFCTVVGGFWVAFRYIDGQFKELNDRVSRIEYRMESATDDRWRMRDMEVWALRMSLRNPSLSIPDPSNLANTLKRNGEQ